jgi:hypothetical protein
MIEKILGIYSSKQPYNIQFPSTHKLYPNGSSPYEMMMDCQNIHQGQLMGSLYIKSTHASSWDRLVFVSISTNEDEMTLVTNRNHLFSGRYKLFFAFDQVSVVFISFNLDLKYELSLKKTKTRALPSPTEIHETISESVPLINHSVCTICTDSTTTCGQQSDCVSQKSVNDSSIQTSESDVNVI